MNAAGFAYALPHITVHMATAGESGRPRYVVNGKPMLVEAAAKEYLRSQGWWVTRGTEASLFLAVLSANFSASFFADVCNNYVGAQAPVLIKVLDELCNASLQLGAVSVRHLEAAADFLCRYYASESTQRRFRRMASEIGALPAHHQVALVRVYRKIGYFTKGIPDLFATKASEFTFIEVKSERDSLRSEQYTFAEALFQENIGGFQVLRVVGSASGGLEKLLNPADAEATVVGARNAIKD